MLRSLLAGGFLVGMAIVAVPMLQERVAEREAANNGQSQFAHRVSEAEPVGQGRIRLKADRLGHFMTEAVVNGRRIEVLTDTGASSVAIRYEDAVKLGLRPQSLDYTARMQTANGITYGAPIELREVRIGSIRVRNVRGVVGQKGALPVTLLGMSFIGKLSKFEMSGGELVLVQ